MFHFRDVAAGTDFATFKAHQLADHDKCTGRTDSDRYAELRRLVEAWQSHTTGSSQTLADWSHR